LTSQAPGDEGFVAFILPEACIFCPTSNQFWDRYKKIDTASKNGKAAQRRLQATMACYCGYSVRFSRIGAIIMWSVIFTTSAPEPFHLGNFLIKKL
jgi:hypothetical protein